jgi:hypothetical protein
MNRDDDTWQMWYFYARRKTPSEMMRFALAPRAETTIFESLPLNVTLIPGVLLIG